MSLKPLAFLFVLTVVIFVHELGHFLVARWCGVRVKTFSIGFGKEIFGFTDRYGTRWRFAWIPLGGYVKFLDDENSASVPSREALQHLSPAEREGAFQTKPLASRAAIVAAGPIANFLLAILVFAVTFTFVGVNVTAPRVDELVADGAAAKAGFKAGDLIVSIDGQPIETFADMQRIVSASADRELSFEVDRGGSKLTLKATPDRREITDRFGNKLRVGVIGIKRNATQQEWQFKQYGPVEALGLAVQGELFHRLAHAGLSLRRRHPAGIRRPAGRAAPHRRDFRAGRQPRLPGADQSYCRAVGEHRADQPVPDPAARWRSPYVLRHRGRAWAAAERAGAGGRFPHRLGDRAAAAGLYHLPGPIYPVAVDGNWLGLPPEISRQEAGVMEAGRCRRPASSL